MTGTPQTSRTAAALAARQQHTQAKLHDIDEAITAMRRAKKPVTVAGVARRAHVSRTFLYENQHARDAVSNAISKTASKRRTRLRRADENEDAWQERALNAEAALKEARREIRAQREQIAEHLEHMRMYEDQNSGTDLTRLTTKNKELEQRVHQLNQELATSNERLSAARSNARFLDRRISELEAEIIDERR